MHLAHPTHPLSALQALAAPLGSPIPRGSDTRAGIYCIWMPSDTKYRVYVGQTGLGAAKRITQHRTELRGARHHTAHLQHAYSKYGEDAFVWALVEEVPLDTQALTLAEQAWMDSVGRERLFNTAPAAGSALGVRHSAESRANMQRAAQARVAAMTPEERAVVAARAVARMSARTAEEVAATERRRLASTTPESRSPAARRAMANRSAEARQRTIDALHTPEARQRLSAASTARAARTTTAEHSAWSARLHAAGYDYVGHGDATRAGIAKAKTSAERRAIAVARQAATSPEEKRRRGLKAWTTRQARLAAERHNTPSATTTPSS